MIGRMSWRKCFERLIFLSLVATVILGCREHKIDHANEPSNGQRQAATHAHQHKPLKAPLRRDTIAKMIEEIDSPDQRIAGMALQGLPTNPGDYLGNKELAHELVIPTLVRIMNDKNRPPLQGIAVTKLMGMKSLATPAWDELQRGLANPGLQPFIIQGLADMGPLGERAIPRLIQMLRAGDEQDCIAACRGLARFGNRAKTAAIHLSKLLKDNDVVVSVAAAMALGAIGKDATSALDHLEEMTKSKNDSIRFAAERAINKIVQTK